MIFKTLGFLAICFGLVTHESELENLYKEKCYSPSDINEHLPLLKDLAKQCESVVEIGVRNMVSTWGILKGLSENVSSRRSYLGIDLMHPPQEIFCRAKSLAEKSGIAFNFLEANDMQIEIDAVDMLFIDSLHTYCHLTYELEKFSPKVLKFIAMHDTSEPWGDRDDTGYEGDYSEYPFLHDKSKKGLWPAVVDFLERHPEWVLVERRMNNHGFTILKRI
jgi:hypothetical protein